MNDLTPAQHSAVAAQETAFLYGPAGSGKSTALRHRLLRLLEEGEPPYTILVLVSEAEDRQHFLDFLAQKSTIPTADLQITTYTFLAREMARTFWPIVARSAGFQRPYQPPTYLHYDLAQFLLWRTVSSMMREGAFADLPLRPQQIVSQILDTLNRAALNRLSLQEANQRQLATWAGDPQDARHLQEATSAAEQFRAHCRRNSLLDVSLAVRVFDVQLLQHPDFRRYFSERFRHILVDNVEEQTPAGQHFIASLMDEIQTTALAYDEGGGYKRHLSADPRGARRLQDRCRHHISFEEHFTSSESLAHLANAVENHLLSPADRRPAGRAHEAVLATVTGRYRHEMAKKAVHTLAQILAQKQISPDDAAIISPGLDGALRFALTETFQEVDLPYTFLRRRSSPRDEPRIRAWLTWLALAHPDWQSPPPAYDVAEALNLSVVRLDPARAQLLADALYNEAEGELRPVEEVEEAVLNRAGRAAVERVETLRQWLTSHADLPLEAFFRGLYDELTVAPTSAEPDLSGAQLLEWLLRLAGRLQRSAERMEIERNGDAGRAFITVINEGLVSADPPELGRPPEPQGVLVTTVHGYLLSRQTSRVQVWLDASSPAWWDIPRQPLSNAFVLAPDWPEDRPWTMAEEYRIRNEMLSGIVRGLAVRCSDGVIFAGSTLDQGGQRQDAPLWRALQSILTQASTAPTP